MGIQPGQRAGPGRAAQLRENFGDRPGAFCYELYKKRGAPCPHCAVERSFRDGKPHTGEQRITLRDGSKLQTIVFTSPLVDENGDIGAVLALSADITKVKELQEKFHLLFEEVPCYISVQDRELRLLEANRQFRTDFGDEIGERCYRVYKHRTEPCITCPVAETFEDGEVRTREEVVTSRTGEQMNVLCSVAPLRNSLGEIESVMEMSTNITELRQVQSQLTSLGMLVGTVAHGIKGPLSGLDGGLYLMDSGFNKEKPERIDQGRGCGIFIQEHPLAEALAAHGDQAQAGRVELPEVAAVAQRLQIALQVIAPAMVVAGQPIADRTGDVGHQWAAAVAADIVKSPDLCIVPAQDNNR